MHPYSSIDTTAAWRKLRFILLVRSDFHMTDSLLIAVYAFASDVLLWTSSHGQAKEGQPARTYIQQLCIDIGCGTEDLPEAMNDREGWQEKVRDIHADGTTKMMR